MPVVVLGPDFWKNEFASDPAVVGRTVRLNGRDFTVIGVAPESFPGMQIFAQSRLLHAARHGAGVLHQPAETLLRGPGRSRVERQGALAAGRRRCGRRRANWRCWRRDFERDYPELNRNRGAAVRTQFEMLTRTDTDASPWKFMRDLRRSSRWRSCWWRAPTWRDFF